MRFVQKVSGLTIEHEVDIAYGVLNPNCLQHSSLPQLLTLPNVSVTVGNILRTPLFGMSNSVFVEFHLMSSVASNWCPFRTFLSLGNRKKSHGARSGEYGGCCK
jgi:hypothetical protein